MRRRGADLSIFHSAVVVCEMLSHNIVQGCRYLAPLSSSRGVQKSRRIWRVLKRRSRAGDIGSW